MGPFFLLLFSPAHLLQIFILHKVAAFTHYITFVLRQ